MTDADQLVFPGFSSEPEQKTERLFFGLYPDPDTALLIAKRTQSLRDECGLTGEPLAPARLHVTLHHIGDFAGLPQHLIVGAVEAADSLRAAPFDVVFDRAMSFGGQPGNNPFVLRGAEDGGLSALMTFRGTLSLAMAKTGRLLGERVASSFTPHVTLLYDGRVVTERLVEPIRWTVREFVLVRSLLGKTRHIVIGRWPLRG